MERDVPDPMFVDPDFFPKNHYAMLSWRDMKKNNPEQWQLFTTTIIDKETVDFLAALEFAELECKIYGKKMAKALTMDPDTSVTKKGKNALEVCISTLSK